MAGVIVGGALAIALWVWDEPPTYVERWRQGRDGERATAKQLRKLRRRGWCDRHDLADEYGNLDQLIVGPDGVFLLDSKNLWGTFAVSCGVLSCSHPDGPRSDYSMPRLPRSLCAASRSVDSVLKNSLGWIVDMRPVVVLWANFPAGEAVVDGVAIVRGDLLTE